MKGRANLKAPAIAGQAQCSMKIGENVIAWSRGAERNDVTDYARMASFVT
jgi:hypothetical protein